MGIKKLRCTVQIKSFKPLFHSSQKPTRKLAASAFKYCDWMKVLAANLRISYRDEWKRRQPKFYSLPKRYKQIRRFEQRLFVGNSCGIIVLVYLLTVISFFLVKDEGSVYKHLGAGSSVPHIRSILAER